MYTGDKPYRGDCANEGSTGLWRRLMYLQQGNLWRGRPLVLRSANHVPEVKLLQPQTELSLCAHSEAFRPLTARQQGTWRWYMHVV